MMKTLKKNKLALIIINSLINLPTPSNISTMWNFGSLLGFCLMLQIMTGIFLSMHYCPNIDYAFDSIIHINRNVNFGWLLRFAHANGASCFFVCMYIHIGRGIYYGVAPSATEVWMSGTTIFILTMAAAFLGYVLPWGQMSFWGATVITNLISAVPYLGNMIVSWIWGGFSVNKATLARFYSLHFLFPFIITALVMIHLLFLHQTGSSNPLGTNSNLDKLSFHPFFTLKDLSGILIMSFILMTLMLQYPYILSDPDNFTPANPLVTPVHIQPEWYFLFAYAILRSIPNKLGGVLALASSILVLYMLPFSPKSKFKGLQFYPLNKMLFWSFACTIILLTWMGAQPVEPPYVTASQMLTILYFTYFPMNILLFKLWDIIIFKTK